MTIIDRGCVRVAGLYNHRSGETSLDFEASSQIHPHPPARFNETQTEAEKFFERTVAAGIMDPKGNCLIDPSKVKMPSLTPEGVVRLQERLCRESGTIVKYFQNLLPIKLAGIRTSFEKISEFCNANKLRNPFLLDWENKRAEIRGLNFCLKDLADEILKRKGRAITSIEVIGGDLNEITGEEYLQKAFEELQKVYPGFVLDQALFKGCSHKAPDTDIRITYPCGSYQGIEDFVNEMIDYFVSKLDIPITEELRVYWRCLVRELAFFKLVHPYKPGIDNYAILSICDVNGLNIDLVLVDVQLRRQLFHANGLALDILPLLTGGDHHPEDLIPKGEVCGGWQSILDRTCAIAAISHPELPIDHGWSRLLSLFVRGSYCVDGLIMHRLLNDALGLKIEDLLKELSQVIRDHNNGSSNAFFAAAVMLSFFLCEQKKEEDFISDFWRQLSLHPNFKADKLDPVCRDISSLISTKQLSFLEALSVLEVINIYRMSLPNSGKHTERLLELRGSDYLQITLEDAVHMTFPFNLASSLITFSELLKRPVKAAVLEILANEHEKIEDILKGPSVFSLYVHVGSFFTPQSLWVVETWAQHQSRVLDKIALGIALHLCKPNVADFVLFCKKIAILLSQEPLDHGLASLLHEAGRRFCSIYGYNPFNKLSDAILHTKTSPLAQQQKKNISLLNQLVSCYCSVMKIDDSPELFNGLCALWKSMKSNVIQWNTGWHIVFITQNIKSSFAIEFVGRMLNKFKYKFEARLRAYQIFSGIVKRNTSDEVLHQIVLIIDKIISYPGYLPTISKNGLYAYLNHEIFSKLLNYVERKYGIVKACRFFTGALLKKIIRYNNRLINQWLEFLEKTMLSSSVALQDVAKIIESDFDKLNLQDDQLQKFDQIIFKANYKLAAYAFDGAMTEKNFAEAKLQLDGLICLPVNIEETSMLAIRLIEETLQNRHFAFTYSCLYDRNFHILLPAKMRKKFCFDLIEHSKPDLFLHLQVLEMAMEFCEDEDGIDDLASVLNRQLEAVSIKGLIQNEIWKSFKESLYAHEKALFEALWRGGHSWNIVMLARSFYLWGIGMEKAVSFVTESLLIQRKDFSLDVTLDLLKKCLSTFEKGKVDEEVKSQITAARLDCFFDTQEIYRKPHLATDLLITFQKHFPDTDCVLKRFEEYLSFLICECQSLEVEAIALLLENFLLSKQEFWLYLAPQLFARIEDPSEKIHLMKITYKNGLRALLVEGTPLCFLTCLIEFRLSLRTEMDKGSYDRDLITHDIELINQCCASESVDAPLDLFVIFNDISNEIVRLTKEYPPFKDRLKEILNNHHEAESAMLHHFGKTLTQAIHKSFVNLFLAYQKAEFFSVVESAEFAGKMAMTVLSYVRIYCNDPEMLHEMCMAFPFPNEKTALKEFKCIFFKIIKNPPQEIKLNDPVYYKLCYTIMNRLICCDNVEFLTSPSTPRFFDSERLCELWLVYINRQIEYLNLIRPQENIFFFYKLIENLHLFKSDERVLNVVLENIWKFAVYIEHFGEGHLNYQTIFHETMAIIFSDFFSAETSTSLKIQILENPLSPIAQKKSKQVTGKKRKIMEASRRYFSFKYRFCMQLMRTDDILATINQVIKISYDAFAADQYAELNESVAASSLPQEPHTQLYSCSKRFVSNHLRFIRNAIHEMILGYCHNLENLVELVSEFIFMKLPFENDEETFLYHLVKAMEIFDCAMNKDLFVRSPSKLSKCLIYCRIHNYQFVIMEDYNRRELAQTFYSFFQSNCVIKVAHGVNVFIESATRIYDHHPQEFVEIFTHLLEVAQANPYVECSHMPILDSIFREISSFASNSGTSSVVEIALVKVPLYYFIGLQMLQNCKFVVADPNNESYRQTAEKLFKMYFDGLFQLISYEVPEDVDYEKYHVGRFACEYMARALASVSDDMGCMLMNAYYRMIELVYLSYMNNERLTNKDMAYEAFERLLFKRQLFSYLHSWILTLLQSGNPLHIAQGRHLFTKALRSSFYDTYQDEKNQIFQLLKTMS